jgi:uncharacterized protein YciI
MGSENNVLNEIPLQVFIILAETLEGWKNPNSEEGKEVLLKHYAWGADLKANGKIILAGPTDFDLTSTGKINPIGNTTGLIMLNVQSREEAEELAFKDPFHTNGFRRNTVQSMKITITDESVYETLKKQIKHY